MDASNSSIREINSLFTKKELKPSELYSIVFENAASSEAALHAHLTLFEEENIKKHLNLIKDSVRVRQLVY